MTCVKVCGLTPQAADWLDAVPALDAVGLVFYPPSPRYVSAHNAAALIVPKIKPYTGIVGLFVDAEADFVEHCVRECPIDVLQFHGAETPEACHTVAKQLGKRWYKALQVAPTMNVQQLEQQAAAYVDAGASALLLDAWHPSLKGGTGHVFDWSKWPQLSVPLILAGGLTPENVADAVTLLQPYAVDVSGGVECEDAAGRPLKGAKDKHKIINFLHNVHGANRL